MGYVSISTRPHRNKIAPNVPLRARIWTPDFDGVSDWMEENRGKVGAIGIIILFLTVSGVYGMPNSPLYKGGWEITTSIHTVKQNGITYGAPVNNYPWRSEYWGSSSVRYDTDASAAEELGAGFVDWDWDVIGSADTQVDITNPAHLKFDQLTQEWVPATDDEVFYQYTKTVTYTDGAGQEITEVYFWDHHVYSFWVTVIADPDLHHVVALGIDIVGTTGEVKGLAGVVTPILPRILFTVGSWNVGPDSFTLTNDDGSVSTYEAKPATFWTGIMSSTVMESYAGLVTKDRAGDEFENAVTPQFGYHASATLSGALNMYYTDSPTQSVDEWSDADAQNNYDAIQGVPQEVLIEFFGELEPGYTWPAGGTVYSSAVMYQYRARVDVLITGGYTLASGQQPDDPVDPIIIDIGSDPIGYFFSQFSDSDAILLIIILAVAVYIAYKIIRFVYRI